MEGRKISGVIFLLGMLILAFGASSALAQTVEISGVSDIAPGTEGVEITITVKGLSADADTAQFNIGYDSTALTYASGAAEGTWVLPQVSEVAAPTAPYTGEISLMLVGGSMPASTDTVVATLTFDVNATAAEADYGIDYIEKAGSTGVVAAGAFVENLTTVNGKVGVVPPKNPPVADDGVLEIQEDADETAGQLVAADIDVGDTLTYSLVGDQPELGVLVITAETGAYTYTPNANASGNDTFTFKATDSAALDSNIATITITIAAVIDTPVAAAGELALEEDAAATAGQLVAEDADTEDTLTYAIVSDPIKGSVSVTASTGAYTYTLNEDACGEDNFTFKANDGTQDSNTATVSVAITCVNDAPVADAAEFTVVLENTFAGQLVATDVEDDALIFSVVDQPIKGSVTVTGSTGEYEYVAPGKGTDVTDGDSFSYQVNDGNLDSETVIVTIILDPGTHAITLVPGEGGKLKDKTDPPLEVDPDTGALMVLDGANAALKAVAGAGYYVSEVKAGDEVVYTYEEGVEFDGKFTLEEVAAPVTVTATFERIPFVIGISGVSGGAVEAADGNLEVEFGADKEFVVVPDSAAWEVIGVTVARGDGDPVAVEVDDDGFFTVEAIETSLTIVPTFGRNQDYSSADIDADYKVSISELLRVIQIYGTNGGAYHCYDADVDVNDTGEDGFASGVNADLLTCTPANADYEQDWVISLSELLRVIQFVALDGYRLDVNDIDPTLDGFIAGKVE